MSDSKKFLFIGLGFFILSLFVGIFSVFASTTISYSGSTDILDCTSTNTNLYVAVYRPDTSLIDGGTITGTASSCFEQSNYSSTSGHYYVGFLSSNSPSWASYSTLSALESSSDWVGTAEYDFASNTITNFTWRELEIEGCTYSEATNYDSLATVDDGYCIFPTPVELDTNVGRIADTLEVTSYLFLFFWFFFNIIQVIWKR